MAKVIKLKVQNSPLGFKRARKTKRQKQEELGQLNLFDQQAKVRSLTSQSAFEQALELDEMGDYESAIQWYEKAIANNESKADAYCNLGIIASEKGETTKALDYFTHALKESPRHFETHYNLANAYSEIGNNALAKVHYELVLEINSEFENAYYNLALVSIAENDFKKAMELLIRYREFINVDSQQVDQIISNLRQTLTAHG